MQKQEYMNLFKEELLRSLRLFGWANGNIPCINHWKTEYNLTDAEVSELKEFHKAHKDEPQYQF